jgi:alkanesulfonate monooxygenase SsuD/methylene tetrahydromethanopterin reductase-like flavin-dependent oxidoreductase (luciferase family)
MTQRPKTFAEAHEIIKHGPDRYKLQNQARQWLDDQGKGGAWAGTLDEVLKALDRFYDTGSIGFVIDRSE